jgi:hypothetical protein
MKSNKEQVIELLNEYQDYMGNNRKGGAILNKLSNLLKGHKNNEINNISGNFAYFRENRMKAYDMSLRWDIDTLRKIYS